MGYEQEWEVRLDRAMYYWRTALEEAFQKREELADEVRAARRDGLSVRRIAQLSLLNRATVRKMLAEEGLA